MESEPTVIEDNATIARHHQSSSDVLLAEIQKLSISENGELQRPDSSAATVKIEKPVSSIASKADGGQWSIIPLGARMFVDAKSEYDDGGSNYLLCFVPSGYQEATVRIPFHRRSDSNPTSGLLWRGEGHPIVVTTSGYSNPPILESYELDRLLWAKAGLEMCRIIGYNIPKPPPNLWATQCFPDQWLMCHVEVQLLTYVLCKHTKLALASEFQHPTVKRRHGNMDLAESLGLYTKLKEQKVVLYVDHSVCEHCEGVIAAFTKETAIEVVVYRDGEPQKLTAQPRVPRPWPEVRDIKSKSHFVGFADDEVATTEHKVVSEFDEVSAVRGRGDAEEIIMQKEMVQHKSTELTKSDEGIS